jgi:hypothetical protein
LIGLLDVLHLLAWILLMDHRLMGTGTGSRWIGVKDDANRMILAIQG